MNSASPTTSASTNRGGRPKDWTEPRARRLVRLYIYTRIPFELILKLLEDDVWKPGKDAANKVKNSLLGNDPRWIRPKDDDDERRRITALRNSQRGAKLHHRTSASHLAGNQNNANVPWCHDGNNLIAAQSSHHPFSNPNTPTRVKYETVDHTNQIGANIPIFGYDEHGAQTYPLWPAGGMDGSRKDTGLTNSTETSISSSFYEKLSPTVPRDRAKGVWRVLKQFTFPKDPELQREMSFSPVASPRSQFQPAAQQGVYSAGAPAIYIPSSASYATPGDFLDTDRLSRNVCETGSASHEKGTCWCRIGNDLTSARTLWPSNSAFLSSLNNQAGGFYQRTDIFGNTAFHRLAIMDGNHESFFHIISQALRTPRSLVRATNTAGQTFLHVLHQSWYNEEALLEKLLNILMDDSDFNILATDVYGRSFFHLLLSKRLDSACIPKKLLKCNPLKRRDAFGVKPVESQAQHSGPSGSQMQRRASPMNATSPGISTAMLDIPSERGDESPFQPHAHAELLRIAIDAIKVEKQNPWSEDFCGRNALHCLAEVILDPQLDVKGVQKSAHENQQQKKRKFKEDDGESSPDNMRLNTLEGILSAGVDVNHCDSQGQTPLMAFVKYRPEDSRSEKETMERIIKMLHNAGANLEARNREGETALHVAARFGKKVALKELLQLGANPYVRDACGLSVLAAIDDRWANAEDGLHIARLEACRGVFTSMVQDPAQEPTVLQEWGVRERLTAQSW